VRDGRAQSNLLALKGENGGEDAGPQLRLGNDLIDDQPITRHKRLDQATQKDKFGTVKRTTCG